MTVPIIPRGKPPKPGSVYLSDKDFEEAERLGGVTFDRDVRVSINDALKLAAEWVEKDDGHTKAIDQKLKELSSLRKSLGAVMHDLHVVERSDIPGQRRSLLEIWRAKLAPLSPGLELASEYYDLGPMAQRLIGGLDKVAAQEIQVLQEITTVRRGATKRFQHLDTLILILAENFVRSGGVPSATCQALPSDTHPEGIRYSRETPFLRVLRFVHARLPPEKQAKTIKALEERAAGVVNNMKRWRQLMGTITGTDWSWHKRKGQKGVGPKS